MNSENCWWSSKLSARKLLTMIDQNQIDRTIVALLRMPGFFLIDNYFNCFNLNWSSRHRDWSLILSHFALLNGFLLLLLPLKYLKRYYVHLVCWLALINLSKTLFNLDHLADMIPTDISQSNETKEIISMWLNFNFDDQRQNIIIFLFHFAFNMITLFLLQASNKIIKISLIAYSIMAPVCLVKSLSFNLVQALDTLAYIIFSISVVNYFLRHTSGLLQDLKILGQNIIITGQNEGLTFLCLKTFQQIFVPLHFLLFWILTFISKVYLQFLNQSSSSQQHENEWTYVLLNVTSSIFVSPVSLLSTSIAVTYLSCFILTTIKMYLWGNGLNTSQYQNGNREHKGWEEGMTTLLLTSITAFTDMNENTRIAVIVIISFVVLSSLLQSILEISEPAILSLNSFHHTNRIHHMKVLLLCSFLFYFPLYVTHVYAQIFPVNFWIAVMFSTSLLISARVLDLVIIHCLFWWDSSRFEPWEYLDEVIYYARSFTKVIEFLISISVVVVGVWEAINLGFNPLNGVILMMHCYFNVWQRINHGLQGYIRRRQANKIVNSLKIFKIEQMDGREDELCSICYSEMQPNMAANSLVIITNCKHLFHRQCIKKWLTVQNRCPLCTSTIFASDTNDDDGSIETTKNN